MKTGDLVTLKKRQRFRHELPEAIRVVNVYRFEGENAKIETSISDMVGIVITPHFPYKKQHHRDVQKTTPTFHFAQVLMGTPVELGWILVNELELL